MKLLGEVLRCLGTPAVFREGGEKAGVNAHGQGGEHSRLFTSVSAGVLE